MRIKWPLKTIRRRDVNYIRDNFSTWTKVHSNAVWLCDVYSFKAFAACVIVCDSVCENAACYCWRCFSRMRDIALIYMVNSIRISCNLKSRKKKNVSSILFYAYSMSLHSCALVCCLSLYLSSLNFHAIHSVFVSNIFSRKFHFSLWLIFFLHHYNNSEKLEHIKRTHIKVWREKNTWKEQRKIMKSQRNYCIIFELHSQNVALLSSAVSFHSNGLCQQQQTPWHQQNKQTKKYISDKTWIGPALNPTHFCPPISFSSPKLNHKCY